MFALVVGLFLAGCEGGGNSKQLIAAREAQIQAEAVGDYFIGRRYYTEGTRFWGYLRRPGQPWATARLVIFNERNHKQPDRLAETGARGSGHGFDTNHEYRIWGSYSGEKVYDPNSNFILPEFVLERYELISESPGYLFSPKDSYHPRRLPTRM